VTVGDAYGRGSAYRKAAVLGSPIGQSISPALHRAAYAALGVRWTYDAIECDVDRLPAVLAGFDASWAGLSLTMPLKRAVLPLLEEVSELARAVGGVNTVVFAPASGRSTGADGVTPDASRPCPSRRGDNTDVDGIVAALAEAGVRRPGGAVVLGGGATACSALAAVREMGLPAAVVVVRRPDRAAEARGAAERLGIDVTVMTFDRLAHTLEAADLVISTVPAGAADPYAGTIAASGAAVLDVVYAPWPTALGEAVAGAGGTFVGGFSMLVHQAARQVEIMTGRPAPIAAMRVAGEAELTARAARPIG
jgi:shikimate dehydrogenase